MASSELGQIQDFLVVFRKRKWQVILPALFVLAGGVVFAVIVPKKYVVRTRVELIQPPVSFGDGESTESPAMRDVANAQFHIMNVNRIRETIVAGNWAEYAGMDDEERNAFVLSVRDDVRVQVLTQNQRDVSSSVFVDVEYADTDGKRAERFLRELTQSWIKEVVERDYNQLVAEREEWQNRADAAQREYNTTVTQYTQLIAEMGISAAAAADSRTDREEDPLFAELGNAKAEREVVVADLEELRAKIDALTEQHDALDTEIPSEEVDPGLDLRAQIFAAEQKIAKLKQEQEGRTPENSLYKKAQREIEQLEEDVELAQAMQREEKSRIVYLPNPERAALMDQIAELRLEERGLVAKLDRWTAEIDAKTAEYQAQLGNYNTLYRLEEAWGHAAKNLADAKDRLRSAEAALATYKAVQGEPYRIAEAPVAPSEPSEPNPVVIVIASLLGGIAVGLAAAFLAEFSKSCFRSVGDLSRTMGVPILGVINAIHTKAELRRRRSRRMVVAVSSAAILASVAWFTYTWAYDQDRLPLWLAQAVDDFRLSMR